MKLIPRQLITDFISDGERHSSSDDDAKVRVKRKLYLLPYPFRFYPPFFQFLELGLVGSPLLIWVGLYLKTRHFF